jgi:hypothetical protein
MKIISKIDFTSLRERGERVDRLAFKASVLVGLFGFSIGPIVHQEFLAKALGACASLALAILAGGYLFSVRRS